MRLINTTTFELQEFFDNKIPFYAILSHRWEDGEISFQDFQQGKGPSMKGWSKIMGCCERAKNDGWNWAWVDSCCIDKTSSAELSEAINSMFAWYKRAEICYAYLSDVSVATPTNQSEFWSSRWFARGWTLQELLAPRWIEFYTSNWEMIGTKSSLAQEITSRTGINESHLFNYNDACVAQKMFWASKRQTTRVEDEAYCLMGLFDINMPLLYGEGQKAFYRLQVEILKQTDDDSLFAWEGEWDGASVDALGLLASSPRRFRSSGFVQRWNHDETRPSITTTNKGLRLEVFLTGSSSTDQNWLAPKQLQAEPRTRHPKLTCVILNCKIGSDTFIRLPLRIPHYLWQTESYNESTGWLRRRTLDKSNIPPPRRIQAERFLLFAETLLVPHHMPQSQGPTQLKFDFALDFPYRLVSSHQALITKLHGDHSNLWEDSHAASAFFTNFNGPVISIFFFQRYIPALDFARETVPWRFGVVVIAKPFSLHMVDLDEVHLIKSWCRSFEFQKEAGLPGDWASRKLKDGSIVCAVHKKAFLDTGYSYLITISVRK